MTQAEFMRRAASISKARKSKNASSFSNNFGRFVRTSEYPRVPKPWIAEGECRVILARVVTGKRSRMLTWDPARAGYLSEADDAALQKAFEWCEREMLATDDNSVSDAETLGQWLVILQDEITRRTHGRKAA